VAKVTVDLLHRSPVVMIVADDHLVEEGTENPHITALAIISLLLSETPRIIASILSYSQNVKLGLY
jgi:hypothetical protein